MDKHDFDTIISGDVAKSLQVLKHFVEKVRRGLVQ